MFLTFLDQVSDVLPMFSRFKLDHRYINVPRFPFQSTAAMYKLSDVYLALPMLIQQIEQRLT